MARLNRTNKINFVKSWICIVFALVFSACFMLGCAEDEPRPTPPPVKYVAEIDEKIERINAISQDNNIADSFFYIADLHWEFNDKKSPWIVKYIQSKTDVDTIVFGGDFISYFYNDKEDALAAMEKCVDAFEAKEYYAIMGNHETNLSGGDNDETPPISAEESNLVLNKGRFEKSYFGVEDKAEKIYKVFLNTNVFEKDGEQYNWLKDTLVSLDSDMTVFIFMHIYNDYKAAGVQLTTAKQGKLLNELLSDISDDMSCSIGGIFSAHTHRDFMDQNELGYTVLSTACDGRGRYAPCDDLYERNKGEFSEQAFDVVQVDTSKRKVFLTRIGAGYDREYTY
ncbi:MAG: metallophosphoesterase [Clostridiales bacterium]|nr:metallophosphoesterase [Clostridiales bacterium]